MKAQPAQLLILVAASLFTAPGVQAGDSSAARLNCSNAMLQGAYAFEFSGYMPGGEAFASVGVQTFDGRGHFEVEGTTSIGGFIVRPSRFVGSYALGRNCLGTMYAIYPDGSTGEADIVSAAGGRQVNAILADPGMAVTGQMTRIK